MRTGFFVLWFSAKMNYKSYFSLPLALHVRSMSLQNLEQSHEMPSCVPYKKQLFRYNRLFHFAEANFIAFRTTEGRFGGRSLWNLLLLLIKSLMKERCSPITSFADCAAGIR